MNSINIKTILSTDASEWDSYVFAHPGAILYHLSGWKNVIEKTYGHKTYYLIATQNIQQTINNSTNPIVGILPLVHLKHFLFGNSLISIPFFDMGGVLSDDDETKKALILEAIQLGEKLKVDNIELRHTEPLSWIEESSKLKAQSSKQSAINNELSAINWVSQTRSHKVRMLLDLPESSEILMKSFKSKLRSQINKPLKEGLTSKVGGFELLDDFYEVFSINMRDLGSPVHSATLINKVLKEFPEQAKIVIVYKGDQPVACSVVVGFKDTLQNPWASALREYSRLSPNMLLYWTMLEYACDNGYTYFDFGRSSPDEGTYKFKKQWGSKPNPLHWHCIYFKDEPADSETSEKSKFDKAIHYWQKLPVWATKILGPKIRKHIGL